MTILADDHERFQLLDRPEALQASSEYNGSSQGLMTLVLEIRLDGLALIVTACYARSAAPSPLMLP